MPLDQTSNWCGDPGAPNFSIGLWMKILEEYDLWGVCGGVYKSDLGTVTRSCSAPYPAKMPFLQGTLENRPGKSFSPSNMSNENIRPYSNVFFRGEKKLEGTLEKAVVLL